MDVYGRLRYEYNGMGRTTVNKTIDLIEVVEALAILGVPVSGSVGVHNRVLGADRTLQSNDYILSPEYFRISADATLTLSSDAVLRVL